MAYSVPPQTESQTIDGYGKDPWQPNGGLEGRVFNSRCPPPLTRETIIVSVLGPSDRGNNASPDTDGWLVSDFFLFHHLFRDTALEQHWLTCVSPATLISKYGQYTHGDPHSEDRRTVLDSTFEGELNDVEVFVRYATDIAQTLIRTELEGREQKEQEIQESPTYAAFCQAIHDILVNEIDVRADGNRGAFSAKDDLWDMAFEARSSFPMTYFQEKWQSLKVVPKGDYSSAGASGNTVVQAGSIRMSDTLTLPTAAARSALRNMAQKYFNSFPGDSSAATQHRVWVLCVDIVSNKNLPDSDLEFLSAALQFRLVKVVGMATLYKNHLGISFPDCDKFDISPYLARYRNDDKLRAKFSQIITMVLQKPLFEHNPWEGHYYDKGTKYLAIALFESNKSKDDVIACVKELARLKDERSNLQQTIRHVIQPAV
ncbi:MAG: hypothetical protein FRX48_09434 [Lasallia pustulata]|uniref:Uncharacterized protein n=1 Tax=Lasallia pustulata TaxID=136370 RepID=A0A5M8PBT7_9LECA|nr:MAG: hypothetical protein FRX48_09434 [Lasallia pustulata]